MVVFSYQKIFINHSYISIDEEKKNITECPRSHFFSIATCYAKMVKTSWTYRRLNPNAKSHTAKKIDGKVLLTRNRPNFPIALAPQGRLEENG